MTNFIKTPTKAVSLYSSLVMHRRLFPIKYRFIYRVFHLLIDIDALDDASRISRLFSVGSFNLLSFYPEDHLAGKQHTLRHTVDHIFNELGHKSRPHKVFLLCFPRVLGWVFNPISIWYCLADDGQPDSVICEVRNTFGEKHFYLLDDKSRQWPVKKRQAKHFHVSPFIDMQADYEFRISNPGKLATVGIKEYQYNELMLVASVRCREVKFSSINIIKQCIRVPFQTLKVISAIHWRALHIWLSNAPFYPKPELPEKEVT